MTRGVQTLGLVVGLLTAQCAPDPRSTPCRNDGDCPDGERGRAYCVQQRCVECIARGSCGAQMKCVKGQCVPG
jgi:hypothetical protein